ncbi:glutathione synthase [Vararia minispora EC-137]|uniref:Glutathione synthase n=1 Tax=Vararia minispora EC-137 TaxID=1314806 RepID=A0ACB8QWT0_9AGAM|nr:glutathione synthase [Vararia minispora EC-137]
MAPFPPEPWPPALTSAQLDALTTAATTYALSHSLLYLPLSPPAPPPHPASAIHAPLALFPTPIPRALFSTAQRLQRAYNTLYARVALDAAFLDAVMGAGGVADVDEFTGALWETWKAVRDDCVQPLQLGLFRSDYLLHQPTADEPVRLKQVEFNTVSASFGALSQQVAALHRHLYASTSYFGASALLKPGCFPPNKTVRGLAAGIAEAHRAYGCPSAHVLFIVQPGERNIFDQRLLEYELLEAYNIRTLRQTFAELQTSASLSSTRALLTAGGEHTPNSPRPPHPTHAPPVPHSPHAPNAPIEAAVVYFRAGYTPTDYDGPKAYALRGLLERSRAIQCPSIALQLAGGKKVQEVLARPGVLERFVHDADDARALRETWVGMWGLDARRDEGAEEPEPAGTVLARARAPDLVLKPQREGGGNNVYRSSIPSFLSALPARERRAWIAMELIRPPAGVGGYLVRSGAPRAHADRVVSELGVFGWALFGRGQGVREQEAGWLVRTKADGVDEGGVAAGFSVLDSVLLVD